MIYKAMYLGVVWKFDCDTFIRDCKKNGCLISKKIEDSFDRDSIATSKLILIRKWLKFSSIVPQFIQTSIEIRVLQKEKLINFAIIGIRHFSMAAFYSRDALSCSGCQTLKFAMLNATLCRP